MSEQLLQELPAALREMAAAVGLGPVLALVEWRGGTVLYVPRSIGPEHELALRVGLAAAAWLVERYDGDSLPVPRAAAYVRAQRDLEICQRHRDQGASAAALALAYGLTERQVWRILGRDSELPADTSQLALL